MELDQVVLQVVLETGRWRLAPLALRRLAVGQQQVVPIPDLGVEVVVTIHGCFVMLEFGQSERNQVFCSEELIRASTTPAIRLYRN